jgi:hypothetical protein
MVTLCSKRGVKVLYSLCGTKIHIAFTERGQLSKSTLLRRQQSAQDLLGLLTHLLDIHIANDANPPSGLGFDFFEIISGARGLQFEAVSHEPAALYQPLGSLAAVGIEGSQRRLEAVVGMHSFVRQETEKNS